MFSAESLGLDYFDLLSTHDLTSLICERFEGCGRYAIYYCADPVALYRPLKKLTIPVYARQGACQNSRMSDVHANLGEAGLRTEYMPVWNSMIFGAAPTIKAGIEAATAASGTHFIEAVAVRMAPTPSEQDPRQSRSAHQRTDPRLPDHAVAAPRTMIRVLCRTLPVESPLAQKTLPADFRVDHGPPRHAATRQTSGDRTRSGTTSPSQEAK